MLVYSLFSGFIIVLKQFPTRISIMWSLAAIRWQCFNSHHGSLRLRVRVLHSDLQRHVTISLPQFCQSGVDSEQILSDSCHLLDWVCIVSQVCTRQTEFIPFYPTNTENLLVIHKIFHDVSELTILSVCLTSSSSLCTADLIWLYHTIFSDYVFSFTTFFF